MSDPFVPAIAACLRYEGGPSQDEIEALVRRVLESPPAPSCAELMEMQRGIEVLLPKGELS